MYSLIVFLPLLGAVIAGLLSLSNRDRAAEIVTVSGLLLSLLFSIIAFANVAIGWTARNGQFGAVDFIRQLCCQLEPAV
jgi:NADH:ubiquinone oxidoreductase subunit 5 (subunit L)/multisubunit Na+/H+ antiporter MnhA subunit